MTTLLPLVPSPTQVPTTVEYNLYGQSWAGLLPKDCLDCGHSAVHRKDKPCPSPCGCSTGLSAYRHPAKFSRALLGYIYQHGLDQGYWAPQSLILDPFAGVGCGGLLTPDYGLNWVGVELEAKFCVLGEMALAKVRTDQTHLQIVQGDSRELGRMAIGGYYFDGAITSPPYANRVDDNGSDKPAYHTVESLGGGKGYGRAEGQIGAMYNDASPDAVITSPPFSQPTARDRSSYQPGEIASQMARAYTIDAQGDTPGNLAHLSIDLPPDQGYWGAVGQVYSEVYSLLPVGGVMAIVVKDFVKNKAKFPLCALTLGLLEQTGFVPVERTIALFQSIKPDGRVVEHKSMFRILAEKKGSPRVDWEEVLWVRKR